MVRLLLLLLGGCTFVHTQGDCQVKQEIHQTTVCQPGGSRTVIQLPNPNWVE